MTPGSNVDGRFPKRGHAHFHVIPFPLRSQFERTAVLPRGSGEKGSGVFGAVHGPLDLHGSRSLRKSGGSPVRQAFERHSPEVQRGGPDGRGEKWHVAPYLGWCAHL